MGHPFSLAVCAIFGFVCFFIQADVSDDEHVAKIDQLLHGKK